ncbi:hypothetical protein [Mycobacterium paragordonae]|uniref:hypothetical protein n=1 Tax=Mycobacterium paragordonae TaxID=1389713 RepID=UPI00105BD550|nr:hypothetical protein [Mycobacterium paragordonae]TDL05438.1 hypothetical protein EUA05_17845 [Mycobacterium paragordonae]
MNDPCPICKTGDTTTDDCITISEHIPGTTGPDGVFEFKAHRHCALTALQNGENLAAYGPEPQP